MLAKHFIETLDMNNLNLIQCNVCQKSQFKLLIFHCKMTRIFNADLELNTYAEE